MKIDPKLVLQTLQLILLFACVICDALRDLVSVTIWRLYGRSNACECMLTLFYFPVVCIRLHELAWCSTGSINLTSQEVNQTGQEREHVQSNVLMLLSVSIYHENCSVMSSFTVVRHVPLRHRTLSFAVQLNVFISSLQFFLLFAIFFFKKNTLTYSYFCLGG